MSRALPSFRNWGLPAELLRSIHVTSARKTVIRDLTIRQRRRPWKRRWKIDFASFHFFSRLFQGAQLLKRREFGLELKRRDRTQVLAEIVEFIAFSFPFPSKFKIWSFHVQLCRDCKEMYKKAWLFFCPLNLLLFCRSRCRHRRSFVIVTSLKFADECY